MVRSQFVPYAYAYAARWHGSLYIRAASDSGKRRSEMISAKNHPQSISISKSALVLGVSLESSVNQTRTFLSFDRIAAGSRKDRDTVN